MDPGDQIHTLEEFSHWKIDVLRLYLSCRGLPANVNKQELIALCFSAQTLNMPVLPSSVDIINSKISSYNSLLKVDGSVLPDPLSIFEKWEDEKQGICHWPPTFITGITTFLMTSESEPIAQLHLNQYKIGKAYEYYTSAWLKEVFYHPISNVSPYCYLRAKCTPSMNLNADMHSVWVCCVKESGKIKSAYCSCTSGLGQTCNHVAGLLYRIEDANKLGITSCTSGACGWLQPSEKKLQPTLIKEINFKTSRHGKVGTQPLVGTNKTGFDVLPQATNDSDERVQKTLLESLKGVLQNACFLKGLPNSTADQPQPMVQDLEDVTPIIVKNVVAKNIDSITEAEVESVNQVTRGQSSNPQWSYLRIGRITSSNFYAVYTKVISIKSKKPGCDVNPLLSKIMGYTNVNPNVKSKIWTKNGTCG